ncbi:SAM hydrolase/SAM-dependent halogenase family protein [Fundicoccus culcitae]|uniref:SAM-dependent chlorinase/fluorinase n=1 Tax=Fundicoccus culcitae TaxID=2969821 RepID=A0ABY5PAA6_9LACT|nr:SAM-dependent chlorinase/fluorinase [Fundicoccus culcitae]UUX35519.1 SAM-dependent chlorinase/fluorinase [Fundicoccus culcitae]
MHGVAYMVAPDLTINNLTHDIPPYDISAASYRLWQTINYWPAGTVFVSVVDPGVGSNRQSIAVKTQSGHYVVTPDNGSLTHIEKFIGIESVRVINEQTDRLPHSEESHTFHGRDVYVYNGAMIANDPSYYDSLGDATANQEVVKLEVLDPVFDGEIIHGVIDILDIRFGSLWTNIPSQMLKEAGINTGDTILVTIHHHDMKQYQNQMLFGHSFADVKVGETVGYINSLIRLGIAINQQSFSDTYKIGTGNEWKITIKKV